MTMMSKYATYGECVTIKQRPVARYAPWANPYGQWQDQDGYAAAWRATLGEPPKRGQTKYNVGIEQRVKYLNAVAGGARTTAEIADVVGQAVNTVRKVMNSLHDDGAVEKQPAAPKAGGGSRGDVWFIKAEAAE